MTARSYIRSFFLMTFLHKYFSLLKGAFSSSVFSSWLGPTRGYSCHSCHDYEVRDCLKTILSYVNIFPHRFQYLPPPNTNTLCMAMLNGEKINSFCCICHLSSTLGFILFLLRISSIILPYKNVVWSMHDTVTRGHSHGFVSLFNSGRNYGGEGSKERMQ